MTCIVNSKKYLEKKHFKFFTNILIRVEGDIYIQQASQENQLAIFYRHRF